MTTHENIEKILSSVTDPEIPVLTIQDMGIIRNIDIKDKDVKVTITPTYSGCPAMDTIADDICAALKNAGFNPEVKLVLSPAWTTDWITGNGRKELEKYGIAPPENAIADKKALLGRDRVIRCPRCKSTHTEMISQFGSTACKALFRCIDCKEPFDYFKCI